MRDWAVAEPHRWALIYGSTIPGYAAPPDTIDPAGRVVRALCRAGRRGRRRSRRPDRRAHPGRRSSTRPGRPSSSTSTARPMLALVAAFSRVVGLLTLELNGQFVGGFEPADDLFAALVEQRGRRARRCDPTYAARRMIGGLRDRARRRAVPARRRPRRRAAPRPDPPHPRPALVRPGQPDRPRPRRRVDVHRRDPRHPAADPAPRRDDGRGRAQRLPRRHVGPPGPHQPVHRRHHLRHRRRRPARGRRRPRPIHDRVTGTMPDGTPYAASDPHLLLWVHVAEIDSFLLAHQTYGRRPARPGRSRRVRRPDRRGRPSARRARPADHRGRAGRGRSRGSGPSSRPPTTPATRSPTCSGSPSSRSRCARRTAC